MDDKATIEALSDHINVVLRLAAAAYDQTTLLKRALLVLGEEPGRMDAATRVRFLALLEDITGAEQEAQHAIRLMLRKRR